MVIMGNIISSDPHMLTPTSKEEDRIPCDKCHEGIYVPFNPKYEINHGFICNKCGSHVHFEANVIVE
jgi:formylmethanofuran dehydrogenase subunit E